MCYYNESVNTQSSFKFECFTLKQIIQFRLKTVEYWIFSEF